MRRVVVVCATLALAACGKSNGQSTATSTAAIAGPPLLASSCDKLAGVWRNGDQLYRIKKDGPVYSLNGGQQSFAGSCTNGTLATGSLVGNATYLQSSDHMVFAGVEYARSSEEAEAQRVANEQAQEIAQQQAQQAQQKAVQAQMVERQRIDGISVHLTNCWNNRQECDDLAAEYRAYPTDVRNIEQQFFNQYNLTPAAIAERETRFGPLPGTK